MDIINAYIEALFCKETLFLFINTIPLVLACYAGYFSGLICYIRKPKNGSIVVGSEECPSSQHLEILPNIGVSRELILFIQDFVKLRPGKNGWRHVVSTYANTQEGYDQITTRLLFNSALSAMISILFIIIPKFVDAFKALDISFR